PGGFLSAVGAFAPVAELTPLVRLPRPAQLADPIAGLRMQKVGEREQMRRTGAIVEPEHRVEVVAAARLGPALQRPRRQLGVLVLTVAREKRHDAPVARRLGRP